MRASVFSCKQEFRLSAKELFPFFADASNLSSITPPWLRFEILTPLPITMKRGVLIDYRLHWHGIPIRWRTKITEWQPPSYFVDEQIQGPYRMWRHEHIFKETRKGTVMTDRISYAVPGGKLIDRFLVRSDVQRIFEFRKEALKSLLLASV